MSVMFLTTTTSTTSTTTTVGAVIIITRMRFTPTFIMNLYNMQFSNIPKSQKKPGSLMSMQFKIQSCAEGIMNNFKCIILAGALGPRMAHGAFSLAVCSVSQNQDYAGFQNYLEDKLSKQTAAPANDSLGST